MVFPVALQYVLMSTCRRLGEHELVKGNHNVQQIGFLVNWIFPNYLSVDVQEANDRYMYRCMYFEIVQCNKLMHKQICLSPNPSGIHIQVSCITCKFSTNQARLLESGLNLTNCWEKLLTKISLSRNTPGLKVLLKYAPRKPNYMYLNLKWQPKSIRIFKEVNPITG